MPIKCCKDCVPHRDSQDVMPSAASIWKRKLSGKKKRPELDKTRLTQSIQATLRC